MPTEITITTNSNQSEITNAIDQVKRDAINSLVIVTPQPMSIVIDGTEHTDIITTGYTQYTDKNQLTFTVNVNQDQINNAVDEVKSNKETEIIGVVKEGFEAITIGDAAYITSKIQDETTTLVVGVGNLVTSELDAFKTQVKTNAKEPFINTFTCTKSLREGMTNELTITCNVDENANHSVSVSGQNNVITEIENAAKQSIKNKY